MKLSVPDLLKTTQDIVGDHGAQERLVVAVEISRQIFAMFFFRPSEFRMVFQSHLVETIPWEREVAHGNLPVNELLGLKLHHNIHGTNLDPRTSKYASVVVTGDLIDEMGENLLCGGLSEYFRVPEDMVRIISNTSLPTIDEVGRYFGQMDWIMPFTLSIAVYDLNDDPSDGKSLDVNWITPKGLSRGDHFQRPEPGESFTRQPLRLSSPVQTGNPFWLVMRREYRDVSGGVSVEMRGLPIVAQQRDFELFFGIDSDERLTPLLNGASEYGKEESVPEPINLPVMVKQSRPQLVLVVESTLGMLRVFRDSGKMSTGDEADFTVIHQLCQEILTRDLSDHKQDLDVLIIFYGDNEAKPNEMSGVSSLGQMMPLAFFPTAAPNGNSAKFLSYNGMLSQLKRSAFFKTFQTASKDWCKCLENAAEALTQLPWGEADRVVVWIGQSPPHVYAPKGIQPIDQPGYPTQIDFAEQLRYSKETLQTQHIAVFVTNDIPVVHNMRFEAEQYWRTIADKPQNFFEFDASAANSTAFEEIAKAVWRIADNNYQPVYVVRTVRNKAVNPLLPFKQRTNSDLTPRLICSI